jgi:hypothetical protein
MEHTKELLSISLSNLVRSPHNVRRHTAGDVETLAALIASQGLLHPLIVTEQPARASHARSSSRWRLASVAAARCCCCSGKAACPRRTKSCASW